MDKRNLKHYSLLKKQKDFCGGRSSLRAPGTYTHVTNASCRPLSFNRNICTPLDVAESTPKIIRFNFLCRLTIIAITESILCHVI